MRLKIHRDQKNAPQHTFNEPSVSIRDQHIQKRRKDSENVNITRKRKRSSRKEESPAENTKNSCSKVSLEESSKGKEYLKLELFVRLS